MRLGAVNPKPPRIPSYSLPGVTDDTGLPKGLTPTWAKHARRAILRMRSPAIAKEFEPYRSDAEELLDAKMAQVALVAGQPCGPIEANGLLIAAAETAFAMYFFAKATETCDPKLAMTAAKLGDSARVNDNAAYEMAIRIARQKPQQTRDPLAPWLESDDDPNDG